MQIRLFALCVAVLAGLMGCAHAPSPFPSAEELSRLAQQPAPPPSVGKVEVAHGAFTLKGALPNRPGERTPHPDTTPFEHALFAAASTAQGHLAPTGAFACVAREVAERALETKALVADAASAFIAGRCGATTSPHVHVISGEVPESVTGEQLAQEWKAEVDAALGQLPRQGQHEVGIALVRGQGRATLVIARGELRAQLEPVDPVAGTPGSFTLKGQLFESVAMVAAQINVGRFGYAKCARDEKVSLPQFSFTCAGDPKDPLAWVEVSQWKEKRFLGESVARVLVSPSGAPEDTFQPPVANAAVVNAAGARAADVILVQINATRAEAGVPALVMDGRQSQTSEKLVPHFFGAIGAPEQAKLVDVIALGLMAGWDLEPGPGLVQNAGFDSAWIAGSSDPSELVQCVLQYPSGRHALLDAAARRLAVGTLPLGTGENAGLAAVFTTYSYFPDRKPLEDEKKVLDALNKARADNGVPPAGWTRAPGDSAERAVARIESGAADPGDALHDFASEVIRVANASMRGWRLEVQSLDDITFPEEMKTTYKLPVIIAVARYRERGFPWGSYVILFILPDAKNTTPNVASADGPGHEGEGLARRPGS